MSKKSRRKRRQKQKQAPSRRLPLVVIAAGGGLLVIAAALLLVQPWSGGDAAEPPQVEGAPRLQVDQTVVDEGYVKYNVPVRTAFRLSNVGDQPLKIIEAPQVRLVDGC
jgi:hypothetical protein